MNRFLNMKGTANSHVKAEERFIHSMGRDETVEILYADPETAELKRRTILMRLRGTDDKVHTELSGATLYVRRLTAAEIHRKRKEGK